MANPLDISNLAEVAAEIQSASTEAVASLLKAIKGRFNGYAPVPVVPPPWLRGEWAQLLRSGHCFYGVFDGTALAAEFTFGQVFNPPTSGRRILLFSVGCWAAAAVRVQLQGMDQDSADINPSAFDAEHGLRSDDGDASVAHCKHDQSDAGIPGDQFPLRRFELAAGGVWQDYERADGGIIAECVPGTGVMLRGMTANKAFSGRFGWAEVPIQGPLVDNGQQRVWP